MKLFAPHLADFYKTGHLRMYPEGTEQVLFNFTPRSAKLSETPGEKVVFLGLQGLCKWLLIDLWDATFFDQPRDIVVNKYQRRMDSSLGPGAVSAENMGKLHDLGYLPILIKALPEGSKVNIGVPLWTIESTHKDFAWVAGYLETQLSAESWKTITTATIAHAYRRLFEDAAEKTGIPKEFIPWQGHDFSARGMSGCFDASQSGLGHLLSFFGTDTIHAIDYVENYYGPVTFTGGSVPASEHSVICMGGKETEIETFRRLIKLYPSGIVSLVADTWNFWDVLTKFAPAMKGEILARQFDALGFSKVVFRPDSGDPVHIICGDPDAPEGSPERKGAMECLWDTFGGEVNEKGYKVLCNRVGLIYGDSITYERAYRIINGLMAKGFAPTIVFGIGSFTYQHLTRDTFGHAMKATFGIINGEDVELQKDPVTDNGTKKSLKGRVRVEKEGDDFVVFDQQPEDAGTGLLRPVFCNSVLLVDESFDTLRNRLYGNFT